MAIRPMGGRSCGALIKVAGSILMRKENCRSHQGALRDPGTLSQGGMCDADMLSQGALRDPGLWNITPSG